MASIDTITTEDGEKRYRARWRSPDGGSRSQRFELRRDAVTFLATVETAKTSGAYSDPSEGRRTTVRRHAETWAAAQTWRPQSRTRVESALRNHIYPKLGSRPIGSLRPTELAGFIRNLQETKRLSPATVRFIGWMLKAILASAVDDRVIGRNPAAKLRLPAATKRKVVPLTVFQVGALARAMPKRYRRAILVGAATGLRIGELVGLSLDDIDTEENVIHVRRQVLALRGQSLTLGPVKTKSSEREIPVPESVIRVLLEQVAEHGAGPENVIFSTSLGTLVAPSVLRASFDLALGRAKLPAGTVPHDLRHTFASTLLDAGCSIKELQARLGHATATETLNTYAHVMPDTEDRARAAIDVVLSRITSTLGESVSVSCPSDPQEGSEALQASRKAG